MTSVFQDEKREDHRTSGIEPTSLAPFSPPEVQPANSEPLSPDGCCFTTSIPQRAALASLGSRSGLSISPSLTPIPITLFCVLPGVGPQTAPPHSLSKGAPLLDCGGGKWSSGGLPLTMYESPGQPCHRPCPDLLAYKRRKLGWSHQGPPWLLYTWILNL